MFNEIVINWITVLPSIGVGAGIFFTVQRMLKLFGNKKSECGKHQAMSQENSKQIERIKELAIMTETANAKFENFQNQINSLSAGQEKISNKVDEVKDEVGKLHLLLVKEFAKKGDN